MTFMKYDVITFDKMNYITSKFKIINSNKTLITNHYNKVKCLKTEG